MTIKKTKLKTSLKTIGHKSSLGKSSQTEVKSILIIFSNHLLLYKRSEFLRKGLIGFPIDYVCVVGMR